MYKLGRIQGDINISSIEAELEIDIEYTMYDKLVRGAQCMWHPKHSALSPRNPQKENIPERTVAIQGEDRQG